MKFKNEIPEKKSVYELENYSAFKSKGQPELCRFLKQFLGLDEVKVQTHNISDIESWLHVEALSPVNKVPGRDNAICLVSQIVVEGKVIAYYPYVLVGKFVLRYASAKNFYIRVAEAVSDQLSACYLQSFHGGDWLFGDRFAQIVVANCISTNLCDGIQFAPLIEQMERLSISTFEGETFTTGVIVASHTNHYKSKSFAFIKERNITECEKREWFLADGKSSFFIMDAQTCIRYLYTAEKIKTSNFIKDYFDNYYLKNGQLVEPDFLIRTTGPNELSVSDATGKEFVKLENTWRYRYKRNLIEYLCETLEISEELSNAILYYVLKCYRLHISTIMWIPKNENPKEIEDLTTENRIKLWKKDPNILEERNEGIVDKILASDGAMVINRMGEIIYESVFARLEKKTISPNRLMGTGETAAKHLAQNGVAIKVSQDGAIKIYSGDDKILY